MHTSSLSHALEQWRRVVGEENVITDPGALLFAATATFKTAQHVPAVIEPADREQVQDCVRIANQYRIPIYPVSTGKNWGYGSRVPPRNGSVLLRLHRLNAIVEHNEELGYVTVEPGVTQQQLHDYLRAQRSDLIVPTTGSSPHTSVLGNALERGVSAVGKDKNDCVCSLEVVLPNGECLHTGFGRLPNSRVSKVYRWGVGPSIDGLFIQSSLGIVTRMTIWLMRRRPQSVLFIFLLNKSSSLSELLVGIRGLLKDGGLPEECGGIHIVNNYKMLTYQRSYPWDETAGQVPLPEAVLPRLFPKDRREVGWYGAGVVSMPTRGLAKAYGKLINDRLQKFADRVYRFDNLTFHLLRWVAKLAPWLRSKDVLAILETREGPLFGVPRPGGNLRAVYWRKKSVPSSPQDYEPDRDKCGVIWLFIVLPFQGDVVEWATRLIEQTTASFEYEPVIEIHAMSHRSVLIGSAVLFDRESAGQDERAHECHEELFERFMERGYYPYRLGIQHVDRLPQSSDYYDQFLSTLKRTVDPQGVLAPGRYEFGANKEVGTDKRAVPYR